jgi:hypothetical protein
MVIPVFADQEHCDESKYGIKPPLREPVVYTGIKGKSIGDVKEFIVYLDKGDSQNHFMPSGWLGDYADLKMEEEFKVEPHSGASCVQFSYNAKKSQGQGWAGVYWQSSPNNWGSTQSGFNLTSMTKLSFWAKGAKGGEVIQKFMVGGIKGLYPDSTVVELGPITLTNTWKPYVINLAGKDLSYVNGGFGWVTTQDLAPEGVTFYLDDIKFEADPNMKPQGRPLQGMPFYIYSGKGTAYNNFIPSGWLGDYGDIEYDGKWKENVQAGSKTCIKITYCSCAYQGARWAGIYWQYPVNNWGNIDAGYDLSKATKLTFWARGEKGGERIDDFKIGGISGKFGDSDTANTGAVTLNKEWTQYTIDLTGKNLTNIIGGFCWVANMDANPQKFVFYLDDIKFE